MAAIKTPVSSLISDSNDDKSPLITLLKSQLIDVVSEESALDTKIQEEYAKLNEKCEGVIKKINNRKKKNNKK